MSSKKQNNDLKGLLQLIHAIAVTYSGRDIASMSGVNREVMRNKSKKIKELINTL